ncbi:MAG TPA: histidine kinase [Chitinophagaceae bacterium]|nr:histidine kinase [Chitinophagaceae bacterium]
MRKFFAILIIVTCCSHLVQAQERQTIDSLLRQLPLLGDTARIDCLNRLGFEYSNPYWNQSHRVQTDTAVYFTLQAQTEARRLRYICGIGAAYQNLGMVAEQRGDISQSEHYTRLALSLLEGTRMQAEWNRARVNLGFCAFLQGRFHEAIFILTQTLPYYQWAKDTTHVAMIYRMIANNYKHLGFTAKAFEYIQKNIAIKKKKNDFFGNLLSPEYKSDLYLIAGDTAKAIFYYRQSSDAAKANNATDRYFLTLSKAFSLQNKYDSALYYLQQNIRLLQANSSDPSLQERLLLMNTEALAGLYVLAGNYHQAIVTALPALSAFEQGADLIRLLPVLKHLAQAYEGQKNFDKAIHYAKRLLVYAEKSEARPWQLDAYKILWRIYDRQHKTALAYKFYLKYTAVKDFIEKDNYKAKIAAWEAITNITSEESAYEIQLKEAEEINHAKLLLLEKKKKVQLYIFTAVAVISILLFALIVRTIQLNRRKERLRFLMAEANTKLQQKNTEQKITELLLQKTDLEMQALRAQMNPHFIFNCLSSINRFILMNETDAASAYLIRFSRLIRMVLTHSKKTFITLEDELEMLRLYLDMERMRFKNAFDYSIIFKNTIDSGALFIPPMVLQPFAENAIWHGLMHKREQGHLEITIGIQDKTVVCTITDNGVGRAAAAQQNSKSAEKKKSMGLQITAERLALHNGGREEDTFFTIEDLIDNEGKAEGTKVTLKIAYRDLAETYG